MEISNKALRFFPGSGRFKPTYKGWKCCKDCPMRGGCLVLSLPTRDGNVFLFLSLTFLDIVLSLPTRDGNFLKLSLQPLSSSSFKPTYEGWKLDGPYTEDAWLLNVLSLPTRDGNFYWFNRPFFH